MKKITFIGASGAGKSTFYRNLLQARTGNDKWTTPEEERLKLAKAEKWDLLKVNYRNFMLFCLKTGLFKNSHSVFVSDLLSKKEKNAFFSATGPYEGLLEIMLRYCSEESPGVASKKVRMLSFYLDVLVKQVLLLESVGCNKTVVFDDGIFHNNYGLVMPHSLEQVMLKYPEMASVTNPVAIVHCDISLEENIERRKKRLQKGRGTFIEVGMDDVALNKICQESIEAAKIKVQQFREVGVPVLEIDLGGDLDSNVRNALDFIRRFC